MSTAAAPRRIGAEGSETRARIVEAAEAVIRDEGYAAASTRRVAQHAGLKPPLVHYYFPTTDDLLLAVFRRGAEQSDWMMEEALASDDPVRALWGFLADTSRTGLAIEFMALANRRQAIRAEVGRHGERMRARQAQLLQRLFDSRRAAAEGLSPAVLSLILAALARTLVMEDNMGVTAGHAELRAYVERQIARVSGQSGPLAESAATVDA